MERIEQRISELEDRTTKKYLILNIRERIDQKIEQSLSIQWEYNIYVIRILEGEKKEGEAGKVYEKIMAENASKLAKKQTYTFKKLRKPQAG